MLDTILHESWLNISKELFIATNLCKMARCSAAIVVCCRKNSLSSLLEEYGTKSLIFCWMYWWRDIKMKIFCSPNVLLTDKVMDVKIRYVGKLSGYPIDTKKNQALTLYLLKTSFVNSLKSCRIWILYGKDESYGIRCGFL